MIDSGFLGIEKTLKHDSIEGFVVNMTKKTAHIISHSHWDREWYLPFETHRFYLVQLMDDLLEKLENDPSYKTFHLDGHTLPLDDYFEIRPDKRDIITKYIQEGRIVIGPWYILQDAFLTSAEANVRNLVIGMNESKKYGAYSKLGYFPDTFGIYGQAPQMLKQAGIDTAAFGRGVKPTGFNNTVSDSENFESPYSELEWKSLDGSSVLGILFANWYSNGNEIPATEEAAKAFWDKKLAESEKYASTDHLLYMNGCDHQPLQKDLPEVLALANEMYPDYEFKHSSFEEYIAALNESLPESLQTVTGELRNQRTDGWSTLVNTASARIYLKQMNHKAQLQLERVLEPLATFASANGEAYPEDYIRHAWKELMKNHPHDSICGCSVDEVHQEMVTRYKKVDQMTEQLITQQSEALAAKIDTSAPEGYADAIPLIVFNTSGTRRHVTVEKIIDLERIYFRDMEFEHIPDTLKNKALPNLSLINSSGEEIAATIEEVGIEFDYDLPDDMFRQPYFAKRLKVTFATEELAQFGYDTYYVVEKASENEEESIVKADNVLENDYLRVTVHTDGTYDVFNKETGHNLTRVGSYEDTSDLGNEYMFKKATGEVAYSTKGLQAEIEVRENNAAKGTIEITHAFEIPAAAHEELEAQKDRLVWHRDREARRSDEMTTLHMTTVLRLDKYAKGLQVHLTVDNTAKDHRLRVVYPTQFATDHHMAESAFEIVNRPNKPEVEWANPSFDHHQQTFASLSDGVNGLTVATKGLQEYEIVEADTTLEITVLRSVSELGDWGYFPTPEAQCLGEQTAEWYVIPHANDVVTAQAYDEAYNFQTPVVTVQTDIHTGELREKGAFFTWKSDGLVLTNVKRGETNDDVYVRAYNPTAEKKHLTIIGDNNPTYYESNIVEEYVSDKGLTYENEVVEPYKIVTVGMKGDK